MCESRVVLRRCVWPGVTFDVRRGRGGVGEVPLVSVGGWSVRVPCGRAIDRGVWRSGSPCPKRLLIRRVLRVGVWPRARVLTGRVLVRRLGLPAGLAGRVRREGGSGYRRSRDRACRLVASWMVVTGSDFRFGSFVRPGFALPGSGSRWLRAPFDFVWLASQRLA
jgi:hypothetical protein